MSQYRQLRDLRVIAIVFIVLNLIGSIFVYLREYGVENNLIKYIEPEQIIEISTFFLLFISFLIITNIKVNATEEIRVFINHKLNWFKYFNLVYLFLVVVSIKYKIVMLAALNIEVNMIAIYLMTRNLYAERLRFSNNNHEKILKNPESKIMWRFKIWLAPYEKVKFGKRFEALRPYDLICVFLLGIFMVNGHNIAIIMLIFLWKPIIGFIEVIIPSQTSITGIFTEIIEKNTDESSKRYYRLYITDYENKREYILDLNTYPPIPLGQKLTVVHGVVSKKPFYVKELNLDIR